MEPSPVAAAASPPPSRPYPASVAQRCKRGSANGERGGGGGVVKRAAVNHDVRLVLSKQIYEDQRLLFILFLFYTFIICLILLNHINN